MKIPESPPSFSHILGDIEKLDTKKLMLLVGSSVGPCDDQGRYLHWDKLKHIQPPPDYDSELYWLATKQARVKIFEDLPFKDKKQLPFKFCVPPSVLRDILWISENATGAIKADPRITDPSTKQTYLINSLIEESISSSQLEGASTTRKIAKEMIRTEREPENNSERMILNNYLAMKFIREFKGDRLTSSMIFELHKILTQGTLSKQNKGKAGVFRDKEDNIGVYSFNDVLIHTPPIADELPQRLQLICDFANKADEDDATFYPPIIRAITIHFMIGYDHPFVDGNGRLARALFYWVMAKENYWLMEYISLSRVLKKAEAQYVLAYLHTETDDNDVTYFIIHQLAAIKNAITDLHAHLKLKSSELRQAEEALLDSPLQGVLNSRQLSLLKHALKNPGAEFTIKSHKNSHGITYQTARTDLLKLSDNYNILNKYQRGRAHIFIAPRNLRVLISEVKLAKEI